MTPRGGDPPGVPAALPADHDDDDGGAARRPAARARAPAPAPSCAARSASRSSAACSLAAAHALHDAGHLPLHGAPRAAGSAAAARRHAERPRRSTPSRRRHEHLGAVHPPADRDVAARARRSCSPGSRRITLLPVAPLPRVDFPTISGQRGAARREPRDDGVGGGDAARAPLRPHRRPHRDDLDELARLDVSITLQFDLDRDVDARRARRAGRDQRRGRRAARRTCRPDPTYRKVNPADSPILILSLTSETLPLAQVFDAANTVLAQKISQVERRRPGLRRRRPAAGGARAGRSGGARRASA